MKKTNPKTLQRISRHRRIRSKIRGTAERPRLAVYKSNKYMYAQLINDEMGVTIAAVSSLGTTGKPSEQPAIVGTGIAKIAMEKKITKVVFDRGGFLYRGKIKAIAESARAGGLVF